jgi:hypothetical protein
VIHAFRKSVGRSVNGRSVDIPYGLCVWIYNFHASFGKPDTSFGKPDKQQAGLKTRDRNIPVSTASGHLTIEIHASLIQRGTLSTAHSSGIPFIYTVILPDTNKEQYLDPRMRGQVASGPNTGAERVGAQETIREQVASGPDNATARVETRGSLRNDNGSRRDPTQEQGASGPKQAMRGQVASGPGAGEGRVEARASIREQVASGPEQAYDTETGRVGTQHRNRAHRGPKSDAGAGRVGTRHRGRSRRGPSKHTRAGRVGTRASLRYGNGSRRDPTRGQGASGPEKTIQNQVASGPDAGAGRVGSRVIKRRGYSARDPHFNEDIKLKGTHSNKARTTDRPRGLGEPIPCCQFPATAR